ncbi:MAG: HEAT repeat domain-containing protein [Cyanobacteria bacterium J06588_5]
MRIIAVDIDSAEPGSVEGNGLEGNNSLAEDAVYEELSAQIQLAVEQLAASDFHGRWDAVKRFSRKFSEELSEEGNALGGKSRYRVVPILIQQLQAQKDPDVQWFLVRILSQFEHPMTVAALAELLLTTESEDLQLSASRALSNMGAIAVDTLSDLLSSKSAALESSALESFKTDTIAKPAIGKSANRLDIRRLAARTLAHIRRGAVIEPLLSVVDDPDTELRAIAIEALGSFHDPRITPVLLNALEDDHPATCIEVIRALGRRRDLLPTTDLVSPLRACLRSPNEVIACESAAALGRLSSEDAIIALGEGLGEPLPTAVKRVIASSLGWLNHPAALAYLVESFQRSEPFTTALLKQSVAKALGQVRDEALKPQAARPLIHWLDDGEADGVALTQNIISALARLGVPAALRGIVPVLTHVDSRLRLHALNALKQIDPRKSQQMVQQYLARADVSAIAKQRLEETLSAW